ncbi:hypothetical protein [Ferrimonas sp. SCSIO 43195]|uniref:hypothetical protein n=1 Tax=Ferrimonas sp. SCSIO 43195 TaxID=2822844 RepID=UPI002074F1D5|nr:hypothetical protein [Ferrimonas sp. SCSIO 43195]USD38843.1 hypothetical protein J8Z22_06990 [Ferrimonas sp. SCSIO 43195]
MYRIREQVSSSTTYNDSSTSTSNFQYRLQVTSHTRFHATAQVSNQVLGIISTEA